MYTIEIAKEALLLVLDDDRQGTGRPKKTTIDKVLEALATIKAENNDFEKTCKNCMFDGQQCIYPGNCTSCTPCGDVSILRNWKPK